MRTKKNKHNAIEKALDILETFIPHNQEMGTAEMSERLGLHRATASRTLQILARRGFLQQNPNTKKFRLGRLSLELGKAISRELSNGLIQIAKPYLDDLCRVLEETVILEVFTGTETFIGYIVEGVQRVRVAGTLGDRLPVHAAAGARAVLAFLPPETVERLVGKKLPPLTPNTITDFRIFTKELERVRTQGVSFDNEEIDVGINAIAVPIFNHNDLPVAAVVVAGPSRRIRTAIDSPLVSQLKEVSAKISGGLRCEEDLETKKSV
jgi:DNA-binding IclR family transcriptional regulator